VGQSAPREHVPWSTRAALSIYVTMLVVGVLSPAPQHTPLEPDPVSGEIIGQLADAIRNVVLFLPIGAGLMMWRRSAVAAVVLGLSLSVAIELVQQFVPGRHPSIVDLGANSLGSALGAGLYFLRREWLAPTQSPRLALAAGLGAAALLAGGALLLHPVQTDATYFGGWTPELGHLERYDGRVLEARVGTVAISSGGPVGDTARLREALLSEAPIVIRGVAGSPPAAIAPLVTINDAIGREILFVGVDGADLVLRWRMRGASLGFESPSLRSRDALAGLAVGQSFTLQLKRAGRAVHLELAGRTHSPLRWTPGRTWALLVPGASLSVPVAAALDVVWLALLIMPGACLARTGSGLLAVIGGSAGLLFALPLLGPIGYPPAHEWFGLALGGLAAAAWGRIALARPKAADGLDTS
jgi:VanZ family protein